jgi:hypothetical protein
MTVIELGEVSSGPEPDVPVAPPPRSHIRRVAVLAVAVLCLLAVTGSERPDPRGLPTLWTIPFVNHQFTLTADTLYAFGSELEPVLTAYDSADGSVRWTRAGNQPESWVTTDVPGLVLLPVVKEETVVADGNTYSHVTTQYTVALDPLTGAERWRATGDANLWGDGLILMTEWSGDEANSVSRFRAVRTSDGATLWTLKPDRTVTSWTTTGPEPTRPDRFVTLTGDGRLEVRRLADGVPLSSALVPWADGTQLGAFTQLSSAGQALLVLHENAGRQSVSGYDPDTLKVRWTKRAGTFNSLFGCGALLCVSTAPGEVEAVEPMTGRNVWRGTGWESARPVPGSTDLVTDPFENYPGGLIDGATGRRLVEFEPGTTYIDRITGDVLMVGLITAPPLGASVTQVTGSREIIMRGRVGPTGDIGCQYAAGRLACPIRGGTLSVIDMR